MKLVFQKEFTNNANNMTDPWLVSNFNISIWIKSQIFSKSEFPGHYKISLIFKLYISCYLCTSVHFPLSGFKIQSNSEGIKTVAQLKWPLPGPFSPPRCVEVKVESYGKPAGRVRNVHSPLLQPLLPCFIPKLLPQHPHVRHWLWSSTTESKACRFQALCSVTAEWCSYLFNLSTSLWGLALQPATEVVSHLLSERNIF